MSLCYLTDISTDWLEGHVFAVRTCQGRLECEPHGTTDPSKVTCPECLEKMKGGD